MLRQVESERAFASDLLHAKLSTLRELPSVKAEDAALATELALGTLRWQRRLDHILDAHAKHKKLDAPVRIALRLGAYQILFLDRIPSHAAVNESVELVKKAKLRSAAGLVNAVLRKLATEHKGKKDALPPMPRGASPAECLAIRASHPTWLVERWLARFGDEPTESLLGANNSPAPLTLYVNASPASELARDVARDTHFEQAKWLGGSFRIRRKSSESFLHWGELFSKGLFVFQDEASQMVAHLLEVRARNRVLDCCSAPGGKAILLAHAAGPEGSVFAADLHFHRLVAMKARFQERENVAVLGAEAARAGRPSAQPFENPFELCPGAGFALLALDATRPLPFSARFDRILVDAPCSGTGTLARNPEIRWRLTPADLLDLQSRQRAILSNALDALAPGGRLVYSTCSLEPEENELVVEPVLAAKPGFRIANGRDALRPHLHKDADVNQLFDEQGYFRTFPHLHGTDGFFAAVIQKM